MSYTVSIRDLKDLERRLLSGEPVELPDECRANSRVIREILRYAGRLLPTFDSLEEREVCTIADAVAYILRTDNLHQEGYLLPPIPLATGRGKFCGEDGIAVHLAMDPEKITNDTKLPDERRHIGAEFFRCYNSLEWMPEIKRKLDPNGRGIYSIMFPLADLTALLLNPSDLYDYKYTPEELAEYTNTISREMKEI